MIFLNIISFYHVGNNFDSEGFIDCMSTFLYVLVHFFGIPFLIVFGLSFILGIGYKIYKFINKMTKKNKKE